MLKAKALEMACEIAHPSGGRMSSIPELLHRRSNAEWRNHLTRLIGFASCRWAAKYAGLLGMCKIRNRRDADLNLAWNGSFSVDGYSNSAFSMVMYFGQNSLGVAFGGLSLR